MGVPEPAHLVGVAKACPRPGCRSTRVKWRYYNNNLDSQPRYWCRGCEKYFTYGGKIRLSKQEKQAALEEAARETKQKSVDQKAGKKPAAAMRLRSAKLGAANDQVAVEPPKRRFSSVLRVIAAAPIPKAKNMNAPRIRLRVIGGAVIDLYSSSEVETDQAGAADASALHGEPGHGSGVVASAASVDESCVGPGGSEPGVDSGPVAVSSESGLPDIHPASGGSETELDSEESVITGHASVRSWECLFL